MNVDEIIIKSGLHKSRVINIYLFGSRIYQTNNNDSDYDILIVAKTPYEERELKVDEYNIHILSKNRFIEGLKQNNIKNIECVFSPIKVITDEIKYELNIKGLRHSISHTSSNSWVKAKKKIQIGEYYIGVKSLFHSIRIPLFGKQLCEKGEIYDWCIANDIWRELNSREWKWEELNNDFHLLRNKILTEFRYVASEK
jgi:predicted nucleotidyltransferase